MAIGEIAASVAGDPMSLEFHLEFVATGASAQR
jgi:hypothetical protein